MALPPAESDTYVRKLGTNELASQLKQEIESYN